MELKFIVDARRKFFSCLLNDVARVNIFYRFHYRPFQIISFLFHLVFKLPTHFKICSIWDTRQSWFNVFKDFLDTSHPSHNVSHTRLFLLIQVPRDKMSPLTIDLSRVGGSFYHAAPVYSRATQHFVFKSSFHSCSDVHRASVEPHLGSHRVRGGLGPHLLRQVQLLEGGGDDIDNNK